MTQQSEILEDQRTPIVSVVVPAKDDEQFIRPCLRSIREHGFASLECVVVDDGSSDGTLRIAEEFAAKDPRFSVVSHASSRGPSAARNTGLANSSAPFVTFLDADDYLYPDSIKRRIDALVAADSSFVAGTFCDWQSTPENQGRTPPDRPPASRDELVGFVHGPECPFIVTAPVVRRDVLELVGGFNEALPTAEDFDLWVRILREGYTFEYVPIIGVAYRQKASGLVFSASAHHAEAAVAVIEGQHADLEGEPGAPLLARPLPHYQLACARARRLLRTYTLAAACNEQDDVDRIVHLLPPELNVLSRAGLNVEGELRAGAWRASRAIPELRDRDARARFVQRLMLELDSRRGPAKAAEATET